MRKFVALTIGITTLSLSQAKAQTNNEEEKPISTGDTAPAFTAPDTLGTNISLSDYEGKYLVIDFWASWCGDCRREIPELKKVFTEFNEEIIGPEQVEVNFLSLSFDHNAESWKSMLRKEQFTWPQISTLEPWKQNPIAKAYKIKWIPTFMVVNPVGKVVGSATTANGLRDILTSLK